MIWKKKRDILRMNFCRNCNIVIRKYSMNDFVMLEKSCVSSKSEILEGANEKMLS